MLTEAFDLAPVRWVIHAVGPIYQGPQDAATLTSAYTQALARADEVGATTVAFPSISTGAYGYPLAEAAAVSVQALCGAVTAVQSVLLVAFSHRGGCPKSRGSWVTIRDEPYAAAPTVSWVSVVVSG